MQFMTTESGGTVVSNLGIDHEDWANRSWLGTYQKGLPVAHSQVTSGTVANENGNV